MARALKAQLEELEITTCVQGAPTLVQLADSATLAAPVAAHQGCLVLAVPAGGLLATDGLESEPVRVVVAAGGTWDEPDPKDMMGNLRLAVAALAEAVQVVKTAEDQPEDFAGFENESSWLVPCRPALLEAWATFKAGQKTVKRRPPPGGRARAPIAAAAVGSEFHDAVDGDANAAAGGRASGGSTGTRQRAKATPGPKTVAGLSERLQALEQRLESQRDSQSGCPTLLGASAVAGLVGDGADGAV